VWVTRNFINGTNNCPPESGGQRDREADPARGGSRSAGLQDSVLEPPRRFAPPLLTQEGSCCFLFKSAFRTNTPPLGAPNVVKGKAAFGTIIAAGDPTVIQCG